MATLFNLLSHSKLQHAPITDSQEKLILATEDVCKEDSLFHSETDTNSSDENTISCSSRLFTPRYE